jgi:hypothetical protein
MIMDWNSEPAFERSSTFFYADEVMAEQERQVGRTTNTFIALLLAGAAVLGVGLALMEMVL